MTVAEGTAGDVDVLGRESTGHLAHRQAERRQLALVELDLNLLLETTRDHHRGDAFDALERAFDVLLTEKTETGELVRTEEADAHDGVERWVVLQENRQLGVRRQPDTIEPVADIEGGEVHVGVPRELEGHLGNIGP